MILVTGGYGCIGAELIKWLLQTQAKRSAWQSLDQPRAHRPNISRRSPKIKSIDFRSFRSTSATEPTSNASLRTSSLLESRTWEPCRPPIAMHTVTLDSRSILPDATPLGSGKGSAATSRIALCSQVQSPSTDLARLTPSTPYHSPPNPTQSTCRRLETGERTDLQVLRRRHRCAHDLAASWRAIWSRSRRRTNFNADDSNEVRRVGEAVRNSVSQQTRLLVRTRCRSRFWSCTCGFIRGLRRIYVAVAYRGNVGYRKCNATGGVGSRLGRTVSDYDGDDNVPFICDLEYQAFAEAFPNAPHTDLEAAFREVVVGLSTTS